MENCLLCLEENKDDLDTIKVNSSQWLDLNIQNLIEKHLWNMEPLSPFSWICLNCWQELHDFHIFYMRIEETHMQIEDTHKDENKDLILKIDLNESHLESETIIDQSTTKDIEPFIKEEVVEDLLEENIPLVELRHSKDVINDLEQIIKDPLKNLKQSKSFSKKNKKTSSKQLKRNLENSETEPEFEENSDSLPAQNESKNLSLSKKKKKQSCKKWKINSENSETEPELEDADSLQMLSNDLDYSTDSSKIARPLKRSKKLSYNSDSGNLQTRKKRPYRRGRKEETKRKEKPTLKERDEFLAKNFKMSCVLCQIPMADFGTLTAHFDLEHKEERPYVICCNRKFYARCLLMTHIYRHVDPNKFKCNQCGRILASKIFLNNHLLTHVPEEELKFPCSACGKRFATSARARYHLQQVHLKLFYKICEVCGKSIKREEFDRHMLEHEGKSLTVYCKICGLGLSHKHVLRHHMQYQHPNGVDLRKTCPTCNKVSANIVALRRHIAYVHKAKNVQTCKICDKTFKTPRDIKRHMATHSDIVFRTCDWCSKNFKSNSSWTHHFKKHHPVEYEEERRKKYLETHKIPPVTEINS